MATGPRHESKGADLDYPMVPMTAPAEAHVTRSEPPLTAPVRSNVPPTFARSYSRQPSQIARASRRRRMNQEIAGAQGSRWDKIRQYDIFLFTKTVQEAWN